MKIVTAAEMREIDRVTSERFGVSSLSLMENDSATPHRFRRTGRLRESDLVLPAETAAA